MKRTISAFLMLVLVLSFLPVPSGAEFFPEDYEWKQTNIFNILPDGRESTRHDEDRHRFNYAFEHDFGENYIAGKGTRWLDPSDEYDGYDGPVCISWVASVSAPPKYLQSNEHIQLKGYCEVHGLEDGSGFSLIDFGSDFDPRF